MFLRGNIPAYNILLHWNFTNSSGYWFMAGLQMAACGPNAARRPCVFGPLSTPMYIEIHRTVVIIWPSDIYLWTFFGSLWPERKNNWEPLVYGSKQWELVPPPATSDQKISAYLSGKKRQGKKGKRGENCKREGGKLKKEGWKVTKLRRGLYFFFFFFFFFAFHSSKPLKFVLGLPKWKFSTGKSI